jgi:hypothetical protein
MKPLQRVYSLSDGIELSFTDSGAPPNSQDYTTLLAIHGTAFNACKFNPLQRYKLIHEPCFIQKFSDGLHPIHKYAHPFNFRTLILHRRDYAGSTPFSPAEIQESKEGCMNFWERSSAQVSEFPGMFIEKERIPKFRALSKNGYIQRSGGIAIMGLSMGWSMGCATGLSLFGIPRNPMISVKLYDLLKDYFSDVILDGKEAENVLFGAQIDPPILASGYTAPDYLKYLPFADPKLASEDWEALPEWVSMYFDHSGYDEDSKSILGQWV